ncbi:MAG: hypothetical protein B7Y80_18965 [Hyphomicrobium sp. 32-62-53]|nr:MAG: hypothetical protein B7Z29_17655 [Hyphomicrobium sp. 12-62-95]OYX97695.1 MAG: hypothetical protein B7Y80_18965 [Hyphomicrobium sp. 32-62-53]
MRLLTQTLIYVIVALALAGCDRKPKLGYDNGRSDGYAVGYNTTCQIRTTLIAGEWDNEEYSRGYRDGYAAGALDCTNSKRN